MATTTDVTSPSYSAPTNSVGSCYVLKNTVDTGDAAAAGDYTGIGADTLSVLNIPAETFVLAIILKITTAQTAATDTITLDVGDGDDPDGWLDGIDAETAASHLSSTGTWETTQSPAFGLSGKLYAAADTIDVLVINAGTTDATDDLVFEISAICFELAQ